MVDFILNAIRTESSKTDEIYRIAYFISVKKWQSINLKTEIPFIIRLTTPYTLMRGIKQQNIFMGN